MRRELLYVYTENLNDCFVNQGINFSPAFEVNFNIADGNLLIQKQGNHITELFWGENITSINLIVGKNGSGKSTILNLLGFDKSNRNDLLSNSKSNKWFALYFLSEDYFILEGNHMNLIKNLNGIGNYRNDYAFVVKFENGKIDFIEYIQEFNDEKNKLLYLFGTEKIGESWYHTENRILSDGFDSQLGYQRQYLTTPSMLDLFETLNKAVEKLDRDFNAKNVEVRINRRTHAIDKSEIESLNETFKLYNSHNKSILVLNPSFSIKLLREKDENLWTNKERYIIEFLEESIFYKLRRTTKDSYLEVVKEIEKIEFVLKEDNFNYRTEYLNRILKALYANKKESIENIERYNWYYTITKLLKDIQGDYFLKNDLIKFDFLNEAENREILELINFYDITEYEREVYPLKMEFSNLSNGEIQFIKHFSNINKALKIASFNKNLENIIILLDEPDRNFHPEWSRKYINTLINLLNSINFEKSLKFQVLLTTHSPFMISDIPKQFITCINLVEDEGELRRVVSKAEFGLMSNFYDLIKNNFFMKYPIGDYARIKFNLLKSDIDNLKKNKEQLSRITSVISLIDDPLIKAKLNSYLTEKIKEIDFSEYESLKIQQKRLEEQKSGIEKKLDAIRMELEND